MMLNIPPMPLTSAGTGGQKPLRRLLYNTILLVTALGALFHSKPSCAQFMRIELTVEGEFGLRGFVPPIWEEENAGVLESNTGRLNLYAYENTELFISVISTEELIMDPENRLPLELKTSYLPGGKDNMSDAKTLKNNAVRMHRSDLLVESMPETKLPLSSTIFFNASVTPHEFLDQGTYRGEVIIMVEYL